ncbi:hypothetical protein [Bifidobacterium sp. B4079]|nr:hypothetical protein [Bifidobacterium sp. B4079]
MSFLADFGLLIMVLICFSPFRFLWQKHKDGLAFVAGWVPLVFSFFIFSYGVIVMYGAEWDKSYSTVTTGSYLLHLLYIFLMVNTFINYSEESYSTASFVFLILLFLVEATALFIYARDVIRDRESDPPSRWWIRTTPYAVIGVVFVIVLYLMGRCKINKSDYSLFYSVAVSVLAVNYLVQIINERIVPREGPYRKTHMAVYNRPVYNGPVHRPFSWKAYARRPKPSPSAGRGEGAC